MNRFKTICSPFLLVPAMALVSAQARAEFRCDAPAFNIDRAACEKAAQSPQALRQYIQRMRMIDNLYFPDYVDEARARSWEQAEAVRSPTKPAPLRIVGKQLPEQPGA